MPRCAKADDVGDSVLEAGGKDAVRATQRQAAKPTVVIKVFIVPSRQPFIGRSGQT